MAKDLVCLDTSVLIEYFRKTKKKNSFLFELMQKYEHFAISVITEFEIYSGSTAAQQAFWDNLLKDIVILPFDSQANKEAVEIFNPHFAVILLC